MFKILCEFSEFCGAFVEPSKLTLIEYLRAWLETSVAPPMRRRATYDTYKSLIDYHVAESSIAVMALQRLRSRDIERCYAGLKLSPASIEVMHAIFSKSLRAAPRVSATNTLANRISYRLVLGGSVVFLGCGNRQQNTARHDRSSPVIKKDR